MARKPRLEFEGAIYHVISRGNYRKPLFEEERRTRSRKRSSRRARNADGDCTRMWWWAITITWRSRRRSRILWRKF